MIIDHERRFVFIHIEKTGGTSYEQALCDAIGMDLMLADFNDEILVGGPCKHISARDLRSIVGESIWNSYFKFAVVRNPYDRLLSHWCYHSQLTYPRSWQLTDWVAYPDFMSFLRGLGAGDVTGHPNKQSRMLCDDDGRVLVDFVGRFESLAADFDEVCRTIGVDAPPLPHRLPSEHASWETYYDEETRRIVLDLEEEDFWRFGYGTGVVRRDAPRLGHHHVIRQANELIDHPGDVSRMVALADLYLEMHALESAALLYRNALEVSPHEEIRTRVRTALRLLREARRSNG